jgi:hypothetical protein
MRYGNIAVKTANIWTVPEDASETTIIGWEQMNELNIESIKHEGLVYCHLGHVPGVIKPHQVSDTEIQMPYLRQGSLSGYLRAHSDSGQHSTITMAPGSCTHHPPGTRAAGIGC